MKTLALLVGFLSAVNAQFNPCGVAITCFAAGTKECKVPNNPVNNSPCYCNPGYSGFLCNVKTTLTASTTSASIGQTVTFTCSSSLASSSNPFIFQLFRQPGNQQIGVSVSQISNSWTVVSPPMAQAGTFNFNCKAMQGSQGGESNTVTVTVVSGDPCAGQTCNNQGKCNNVGGQAQCTCNPGRTGQFCQYFVALTASPPSVATGQTVTFQCSTNIPLSGTFNYQLNRISPSSSVIASGSTTANFWNQAFAQPTAGTFTHQCTVSSGGVTGSSPIVTVTVTGSGATCNGFDCNNGNCKIDNGQPKCVCDEGWWGARCDQIDVCSSLKCQNGGKCAPTSASPFYQCTCLKGFTGNFCQDVNIGAPCISSKDCKGTKCNNAGLEGYCKFPEFTCQCRDDAEPACKKHSDCNQLCPKNFGLCMEDNTCNCFNSESQMRYFMMVYNFPNSPPFVAH